MNNADQNEYMQLAAKLETLIKRNAAKRSLAVLLLRMASEDSQLRMRLLEFVDVLPTLKTLDDVRGHFFAYMHPFAGTAPIPMKLAIHFSRFRAVGAVVAFIVRWTIREKLAPYFIVKDTASLDKVKTLYDADGAGTIMDFLGELVTSENEAQYFYDKYISAIENGEAHIAIKLSSLYAFFGPENWDETKQVAKERLASILEKADEAGTFVTVDAEHYHFRNLIEDIFCEVITDPRFRHMEKVGIVLQAYLKDSMDSAERLVGVAEERGTPFNLRLVKGAYWDTEIAVAEQKNWPYPVFTEKTQTDENFRDVLEYLFDNWGLVYTSPATHNPYSIALAVHLARSRGILRDGNFSFEVLYGLGEPIRKAMHEENLPVRVYTPTGDLMSGMSYFARRILENTSNEGFLLQLIKKGEGRKQ